MAFRSVLFCSVLFARCCFASLVDMSYLFIEIEMNEVILLNLVCRQCKGCYGACVRFRIQGITPDGVRCAY